MRRRLLLFGLVSFIASGAAAPAIASQAATATLTGTVLDQTGGVVADARVTVPDDATALQRKTTSSADGAFAVAALSPGRYRVIAQRQGFAPIELRDVVLNVNDRVAIRIDLTVEKIGESVSVVSAPMRVNTSPTVST